MSDSDTIKIMNDGKKCIEAIITDTSDSNDILEQKMDTNLIMILLTIGYGILFPDALTSLVKSAAFFIGVLYIISLFLVLFLY